MIENARKTVVPLVQRLINPFMTILFRSEKNILCLRKPVSDKNYWYMNVKAKHTYGSNPR